MRLRGLLRSIEIRNVIGIVSVGRRLRVVMVVVMVGVRGIWCVVKMCVWIRELIVFVLVWFGFVLVYVWCMYGTCMIYHDMVVNCCIMTMTMTVTM